MFTVHYDAAAGLIEVRALAFRPDVAKRIATALFERSSAMIHDLSAIAREDAIRYSRDELTEAGASEAGASRDHRVPETQPDGRSVG